jgi:hypothetical protein
LVQRALNGLAELWPHVFLPNNGIVTVLSIPRTRYGLESAGDDVPDASLTNVRDVLERRLNRLVCQGKVPLSEAQTAIASNWISAYERWVDPLP